MLKGSNLLSLKDENLEGKDDVANMSGGRSCEGSIFSEHVRGRKVFVIEPNRHHLGCLLPLLDRIYDAEHRIHLSIRRRRAMTSSETRTECFIIIGTIKRLAGDSSCASVAIALSLLSSSYACGSGISSYLWSSSSLLSSLSIPSKSCAYPPKP